MDRILESQTTECIKRTMLMHQDTFKHQVRELHRLYNVQKHLIQELENRSKHTKESTASSISYPFEEEIMLKITEDQETEAVEVELTLGIGQCKRDRKRSRNNMHLCNTLHDHFDLSSQGIESTSSTSNMRTSSYQDNTRKIGYFKI